LRDQIDIFISDTLLINDIVELKRYFIDFADSLGFDLLAYYYLAEGFRRVPRKKGFRISNFPEAYIKLYLKKGYFEIDPLIDETRHRAVPFHWYEIENRKGLTPELKSYFADARAVGLRDGVIVPVYARPGDIAYFSLGSSQHDIDFSRAQMLELQAVCQHMHLRYNELSEHAKAPKLSKREIQVLELIAQGQSNATMGVTLGVSPNTIDTLVRRCFEKLGVSSRVEAALAAVAMGIILP
jgi:LuxR family transcriptional regulator/LuxR family quorum-sensing system transcriptional regulator CciR